MSRAVLLAAAGLLCFATPAARAVDEPEVLRMRAERLAREGRCADALEELDRAGGAPESAAIGYLRGRCAFSLQRWADAAAALAAARNGDPTLPEIDLELGISRYHQGDIEGAAEALAAARGRTAQTATLDLYEGLVELQRTNDREAAAHLESARRTDPLAVEPIASYYAGLAWARVDELEKAREAFERVQRDAPNSPYALAAAEALTAARGAGPRGLVDRRDVEGVQQAGRPLSDPVDPEALNRWFTFSVGAEYDDNVALLGSDVEEPSDISNESDGRLVWTAEAGAELFRGENWAGGVAVAYYGSAHEDLSEFNSQYPTITGWLDRRLGEDTTLRLQYDFGYAWVDADPYLVQQTFTPAIFHDWGERGTTRFFVGLDYNNFLFNTDDVPDAPCLPSEFCGPAGIDESSYLNRDGLGLVAGADHVVPLGDRVALRAGYRYARYGARGREYIFQGHEGRLGLRADLGRDFVFDVQGSYQYRPYRHFSSFPDEPVPPGGYTLSGVSRREHTVQVDVILEKPIREWLVASLRYSYLDNDSNVDVYDYDRNIVGGYLTLRFFQ